MSNLLQKSVLSGTTPTVDEGLRSYLLSVYNHMTVALAISGFVAWLSTSFVMANMSLLFLIATIALPFVFILTLGSVVKSARSYTTGLVLFVLFAASMGLSLSTVFAIYTTESIFRVFLISSATFAGASLYGYLSNRDLTSIGNFMMIGVIGLIIASIVNLFLASSALMFAISVVGVIAFTGLTMYDTQKLKEEYYSNGNVYGTSSASKSALWGALTLYLDFVNLFMYMLQLLGGRRD